MPSEHTLWKQYTKDTLVQRGKLSFPFLPGAFFIAVAALVLVAPRLVIAAIAGLLLFVGVMLCFLAWKFLQFKKQITAMTKNLEGRIQVHQFHVHPGNRDEGGEMDSKKIVFH
jgi:hypothetical protein